jgi:hypothetical protein
MADAPAPATSTNGDGNRRIRTVLFIVLTVIALIGRG